MGEESVGLGQLKRASVLVVLLLAGCVHSGRQPLRVLVYNIHAGKDSAGVSNLERVAEIIRSERADVALLQEVDRNTRRSGNVDQLAELMRLTSMHGAFGKSLDFQGGEYGIAILSRWPVVNTRVIPLRTDPPQPRAGGSIEPRIAFLAETNGIRVANTHLDASRDETWRLQEVATLLQSPAASATFIGGDFNAEPDSTVYAKVVESGLRDSWTLCGRGDSLTFSSARPVKRIDYLFLNRRTCDSATVLDTQTSDHRPLLVVVR